MMYNIKKKYKSVYNSHSLNIKYLIQLPSCITLFLKLVYLILYMQTSLYCTQLGNQIQKESYLYAQMNSVINFVLSKINGQKQTN